MRATVTIKIGYDEAQCHATKDQIESVLRYALNHLASNGLFTGELDAVVDNWSFDIQIGGAAPMDT